MSLHIHTNMHVHMQTYLHLYAPARASGREGLSAQREVGNALAEYGRSQAQLVDSLVFAKDDKLVAQKEIKGTYRAQKWGKKLDRKILLFSCSSSHPN